jgi:predicted nuclease with TOPRIM domain
MDFFECVFQNETKRACLPNAIEVGERKLGEIQKRIQALRRAESQLEEKLSQWKDLMNRTEEKQ